MVKMNFRSDQGTIFRGLFGSQQRDNKIQSVIKSFMEPEIEKKVAKVIKLDNRAIHPIMQIMAIKDENESFLIVEIFPIALVVEEPDNKYVIPLTDEEINEEEFIEMISTKID